KRDIKHKTGQSLLEFQIKRGKSLNLIDNEHWESIAEGTLKSTQDKIIKILKVPYDIFVNSSYLRQGHADEFTTKTPSERKNILSEVLDLNYYEELSQKARENIRQKQEEIKRIDFQIDDLQIQISRKKEILENINQNQREVSLLQTTILKTKTEITKLEKSQNIFEVAKERLKTLLERYQELQNSTTEYKKEFDKLNIQKNEILEKIKNKVSILANFKRLDHLEKILSFENNKFRQYSTILQELKVIEHIKNEVDQNTLRIKNISNCPTCFRPMPKQEAVKINSHLVKEFNNKYGSKFIKLQNDLKKLNYDEKYTRKVQREIDKLTNARDEKQSLDIAENNLANINQNLNKIVSNFTKVKTDAQKISNEGKQLKDKIGKLENVNDTWQETREKFDAQTDKLSDLKGSLGAFKQELIYIENHEKDLIKVEKEKIETQKEIANLEELALAFGKKGIQAMIIEQSLASIEENANILLKKITGDRMSMKFITQKEKKAGSSDDNLIETLEIKISDELGERDYEMYSGGEAFRINFAIRIALSKLLASRAGTHLKFLAIDEGFGMLDSAGRDDLVAAINSISPDFDKILVITHLQELKDLFPTKIEVTKDETGSHLEVINS
ncbi:MAG: hypothetical protein HW405_780, partial [Candidatus Berkelbacteria bacterium]|nr:hypothetical protein [Candidatus Berkelbacteria bacterium]